MRTPTARVTEFQHLTTSLSRVTTELGITPVRLVCACSLGLTPLSLTATLADGSHRGHATHSAILTGGQGTSPDLAIFVNKTGSFAGLELPLRSTSAYCLTSFGPRVCGLMCATLFHGTVLSGTHCHGPGSTRKEVAISVGA